MRGIAVYIGPDLSGKEVAGKTIGLLKSGQTGVVDLIGVDANNIRRAAFSIVEDGRQVIMHVPVTDLEFRNYLYVRGPTAPC